MRAGILTIMIVAMLFVSLESVADSVDEASFHQTHHAHDADNQWVPDSDDDDHGGDSCQHFCHAHAIALTAGFSLPDLPKLQHCVSVLATHANTRGAAPPIPPPNI